MTDLKDPRKQKNFPGTWSNILKSENELPSGLLNSAVRLLKQLHGISKMHKNFLSQVKFVNSLNFLYTLAKISVWNIIFAFPSMKLGNSQN